MATEQKFLVALLDKVSNEQLFFLALFAIAGFFVWLMRNDYMKRTRRNFRSDEGPKYHVNAPRIEGPAKKGVVPKDNTPSAKGGN